jgi:hypothetical protein
MIATIITNKGLLPLLKRVEWANSALGDVYCIECQALKVHGHKSDCDIKAAIEQLEAHEAAAKKTP